MEEWKEYRLGDVAIIKGGKRLPKGIELISNPNTHPYIRISDMYVNKTMELTSSYRYVDNNTFNKIKNYIVNSGDVILAIVGNTIGLVAVIGKSLNNANLTENCVKIIANKEVSQEYIYYYLTSIYGQNKIKKGIVGAAQPKLPIKNIISITISAPSKELQERTTNILSSLDDKIELNRRINENLEQQAQALFKSWFVDFEPFKDGKFVDSELGMIPEGWEVGTLSDIIKNTISGDWGKEHPQGNHIRKVFCIRGADIPDIKIGNKGNMPTRFILEKNYQSKVLIDGDMVIEISGGSPTQSTGRACRISNSLLDKYNNSIICTNFCKAIKPLSGYSSFLYYIWEMLYNQGVMFSYENGTTGIKNLDINGFIQKELIIIPPIHIATDFEQMIKVFYDKIQSNGMESERLAQLRDTLLPKLMSGELKINDFNN